MATNRQRSTTPPTRAAVTPLRPAAESPEGRPLRAPDDPRNPNTPIDANDSYTLRWKLHLLDMALGGLLERPNLVKKRDLQALEWLTLEMLNLATWHGDHPSEFGSIVGEG